MTKQICNVDELSNYLQLSVSGVRKLVRERKIPFFRVGNRIRFDLQNVNLWLEKLEKSESQKSVFYL